MTASKKYINCFWETDINSTVGFDIVCKRMKDGRRMCKDFEDYLNQRSKIEGIYAKELQKLVRNMELRDENGDLEKSWNQMKLQVEAVAHEHETAAAEFHGLANDIDRVHETLKLQTKQHEDRVSRSHNTVKSCISKCANQHRTYDQKCSEWESTSHELKYIERMNTSDPKSYMKVKNKEAKMKEDMEKSDALYKNAVEALQKAQLAWESDMEQAYETFQQLDEKRIENVREVMWKNTNVDSIVCIEKDKSCEKIRVFLERVDIDKDITDFITNNWTGYSRPGTVEYRNYFGGATNTLRKNGNKVPSRPAPAAPANTGLYQEINL